MKSSTHGARATVLVVASVALIGALLSCWAQPQPGAILWTYDAGTWIGSPPALAPDGTVYLTTTVLCAVTNIGSVTSNKWTFPLNAVGPAAVGVDGTVYIGSSGGAISAIDPGGTKKWSCFTGGGGCPAIAVDGTIYYNGYGSLYAIAPNGVPKWTAAVGDAGSWRSPVIGPDGTIYVASWERTTLYAFAKDGTQRWAVALDSRPGDSPAVGRDGRIYIAAGPLYAINRDGSSLWTSGGLLLDGSPVLAADGTLLVSGTGSHFLYSFTSEGQAGWQALAAPSRLASTVAAVDSAGTIYYSVSNGVWALNASGQVQWAVTAPGDPGAGNYFASTSPIIGPDGTIYAALGSTLYAIASGTNGPAASPWPMYRHDARHTGSLQKTVLQQPQKRSDANFEFQLYAQELGVAYTIEASTNLNTWTSLTSIVANTLPTEVADLTATNSPAKFYRAYSPP